MRSALSSVMVGCRMAPRLPSPVCSTDSAAASIGKQRPALRQQFGGPRGRQGRGQQLRLDAEDHRRCRADAAGGEREGIGFAEQDLGPAAVLLQHPAKLQRAARSARQQQHGLAIAQMRGTVTGDFGMSRSGHGHQHHAGIGQHRCHAAACLARWGRAATRHRAWSDERRPGPGPARSVRAIDSTGPLGAHAAPDTQPAPSPHAPHQEPRQMIWPPP